jgi:hypothetical protein
VHGRSLVGEGTDPIAIDYGVGGFLEILVGLDRMRSVFLAWMKGGGSRERSLTSYLRFADV